VEEVEGVEEVKGERREEIGVEEEEDEEEGEEEEEEEREERRVEGVARIIFRSILTPPYLKKNKKTKHPPQQVALRQSRGLI
jgi:hypothetical protein